MELTKTVRAEKDSHALLDLQENFYDVVNGQISEKMRAALNTGSDTIKEDALADKTALKIITDMRIKKIIRAAVSDAYRAKPAHGADRMFPAERDLYDCMIKGISIIRKGAGSTP